MRLSRAHRMPARRSTVALVSAIAAVACVALSFRAPAFVSQDDELQDPAPVVALHAPELGDVAAVACASCHLDVAREWAETAHALAWVDETYQAELEGRKRPELCAGCHVPEPLLASGDLARRITAREDAAEPRAHGITCRSCHVGEGGVVLGPRGGETPAHPTAASPFLTSERSSEMCASCHQTNIGPVVGIAKDYDGSAAQKAGTACVDCHMRPVERRWANREDGGPDDSVPPRVGRSHALQTPRDPAFLRRAFDLSWSVDGGKTLVVVANRTGHRVPGLVGREMRFEITASAGGASLGTAELVLDTRAYLPVDGTKVVTLDGAADAVTVRATHVDPRSPEAIPFLEGDVAPAE